MATSPCPDSAAPSTPGQLVVTGIERDIGHLRWSSSSDNVGVVGYQVYRDGAARRLDGSERLHRLRARVRQELPDRGRRVRRGRQPLRQVGTARHDEGLSTAAGTWSRRHDASVRPDRRDRHLGHLVEHLARLDRFGGQRGRHRLRALSRRSRRRIVRADERDVLRSCLRPQLPARDRREGRRRQPLAQAGIVASTSPCPDTQPPSVPPALAQAGATETTAWISWGASTDNVGVAGYGVYVAGVRVGSHDSRAYTFTGLACGATTPSASTPTTRRASGRPGGAGRGDERVPGHHASVDSQRTGHVRCDGVERVARVERLHRQRRRHRLRRLSRRLTHRLDRLALVQLHRSRSAAPPTRSASTQSTLPGTAPPGHPRTRRRVRACLRRLRRLRHRRRVGRRSSPVSPGRPPTTRPRRTAP